ncbi:hypothetical protein GCM10025738_10830 [Microbacterium fluvii]
MDLSDPETFEAVYALTTGDQNAADRSSFSEWHAEGIAMTGNAVVSSAQLEDVSGLRNGDLEVGMLVCYDVSAVDVVDSSGQTLVSEDRPSIQPLRVEVVATKNGLGIALIENADGAISCD